MNMVPSSPSLQAFESQNNLVVFETKQILSAGNIGSKHESLICVGYELQSCLDKVVGNCEVTVARFGKAL